MLFGAGSRHLAKAQNSQTVEVVGLADVGRPGAPVCICPSGFRIEELLVLPDWSKVETVKVLTLLSMAPARGSHLEEKRLPGPLSQVSCDWTGRLSSLSRGWSAR